MEEERSLYPVKFMAKNLGVSQSGFYKWRKMHAKRELKAQVKTKRSTLIQSLFLGSGSVYGSPRITGRLKDMGHGFSQRTIARDMKSLGLHSKTKRKFKNTTTSDHKLPVAPNLLMQDFSAYAPNQIWMSDITYIRTQEGWLYLCAIIDLYSRKIVGYKLSPRMTQDIVIDSYLSAKKDRKPENYLVFHSDRGSQYASRAFTDLLKENKAIQSMSRRDCCWDSAPIESLWGRLKTEMIFHETFHTREEASLKTKAWIDNYNNHRPHSSIGYKTPVGTEKQFLLAKAG